MKRVAKHITLAAFAVGSVFLSAEAYSEQLYNLEIVFKKSYTEWEPDSVHYFGDDICGVGDVNGDGYDDIAAGAWDFVAPLGWRSTVYVFFGGNPMDTIPDAILRDTYWGGANWTSLAGGDVNGDGFSDIVVGLPYGPGNVDIYFGGNTMDTAVDLVLTEPFPESFFGCDVSTGDVNGDGYCDIIASDYDKDDGEGAVYVFYGGPQLDNIPDVTLRGHGREGFGMTVGSGGDVNSDGYDDIVVGAWANSDMFSMGGKIYVYYGGNPMDTIYDVGMYGEGTEQCLGWDPVSVAKSATGYDFVIAGTQFWPKGFPAECPGKVYVLLGGNPMDSVPDICIHGQTDQASLGKATCAGDMDGDGFEDVVAGAVHYEADYAGAMYLWTAHLMNMDTITDAWMRGDTSNSYVGFVVKSAGDVDGDGLDEVMTSNYPAPIPQHTVWVCKYTGTGIEEQHVSQSMSPPHLEITCKPNPFRNWTTIGMEPEASEEALGHAVISLAIYDTAGRLVRRLETDGRNGQAMWDGKAADGNKVHGGVYFVRAISEPRTRSAKVILIR